MILENSEENKILKYLSLGLVILALLIILKEFVLSPGTVPMPQFIPPESEIKIDFDFLKSQKMEDLSSFPELPLPEIFGRQNPFVNY